MKRRFLTIVIGLALVASGAAWAETPDEVMFRVSGIAGVWAAQDVARTAGKVALSNALLNGGKIRWRFNKDISLAFYVTLPTGEADFLLNTADAKEWSRLSSEYMCSAPDAPVLINNFKNFKELCEYEATKPQPPADALPVLFDIMYDVKEYSGMRAAQDVAHISGNVALSNTLHNGGKVRWVFDKADNTILYVPTPTGEAHFTLSVTEKNQFSRLYSEYTCSHKDTPVLIRNYKNINIKIRELCESIAANKFKAAKLTPPANKPQPPADNLPRPKKWNDFSWHCSENLQQRKKDCESEAGKFVLFRDHITVKESALSSVVDVALLGKTRKKITTTNETAIFRCISKKYGMADDKDGIMRSMILVQLLTEEGRGEEVVELARLCVQ